MIKTLIFVTLIWTIFVNANACYLYDPEVSTLSGELKREVYPGRPNYEDIKKGDKPEIYYFLYLNKSICTEAKESQDLFDSESKVEKIQLVFTQNSQTMYSNLKPFLGKEVTCTGKLFYWHTAHHKTKVLMDTNNCGKASNN